MDSTLTRLRFASQVFNRPQPSTIPGNSNHSAYGRKTEARFERNCRLPFFAGVEILITTSTAEFPGVTAVEGLKMHWACTGIPAEHASVTAPLNVAPTGRIVKL